MLKSLLVSIAIFIYGSTLSQVSPVMHYQVSIQDPSTHQYHVELQTQGWDRDTVVFKMPKWMPGYYQIMDYAKSVENISLIDEKGKTFPFVRVNDNTVRISGMRKKSLILSYDVKTTRQFVANSYVDGEHAYLIPAGTFFYAEGFLNLPVDVALLNLPWKNVATGLEPVNGKANQFKAADFDILYDSPILAGNLEELPSFKVKGVEHRFMGYKLGMFDKVDFMDRLKKMTEAAVAVIGDIPFKQYTFIAIGPGRGGIEHLNNTTVSFDGTGLKDSTAMNKMMNFLAHEYFHHYNVKRIRPLELGPFDYEQGSKTNLLWLSEGISVYYEYLIVKRAGLAKERTLLANFEGNINAYENNPGRSYQSLKQASYNTWKDGPFGTGVEPGKTISYYDKGPIFGLLLDFGIRQATQNTKSLDDVMRLLYWKYYKARGRGFTDAEVEQTCETVAGSSLAPLFEYVNTTKEFDYGKYLGYAGLRMDELPPSEDKKQPRKFRIVRIGNPDASQLSILKSWLGEK